MIRLLVVGGTVSAAGDNTLITPAAGNRLILHYLMYNPETDNTVHWKFGSGGIQQMRCKVPAESVISRAFSEGLELRGGIGVSLILVLGTAGAVNFTVYYTEGQQ